MNLFISLCLDHLFLFIASQRFLSSALRKYVGTYGSAFYFETLENFRKKERLCTPHIQAVSGEKNFMTYPFKSLNKLCSSSAT